MKQKQYIPQAPVDLTQEEMDGLKRGDAKIIQVINKRITSVLPRKTKLVSKKQRATATPVKISTEELNTIKKTGKLPAKLRATIEKEKKNSSKEELAHYKNPQHLKPEIIPPKM